MLLLVLFVRIAMPQGLQRIISDANCYWQWQKWAGCNAFLFSHIVYYLLHRHFYGWQLKEVAHRNSSCKLRHYAVRSHHNHHHLVDDDDDDDGDDANAFLLKRPLGHFHCR